MTPRIDLCRCRIGADCPLHPTVDLEPTRSQLLALALFLLAGAVIGLWLVFHPWVGGAP